MFQHLCSSSSLWPDTFINHDLDDWPHLSVWPITSRPNSCCLHTYNHSYLSSALSHLVNYWPYQIHVQFSPSGSRTLSSVCLKKVWKSHLNTVTDKGRKLRQPDVVESVRHLAVFLCVCLPASVWLSSIPACVYMRASREVLRQIGKKKWWTAVLL